MAQHYHIITCDSKELLDEFINKGAVGIRPVILNTINKTVAMNWDILADLARVKKDDHIFLHAEGTITGPFKATEDPLVVTQQFFDGPNINVQNWQDNREEIQKTINKEPYQWLIPIVSLHERQYGEMQMDVIFDYIAKGIITSLPQRLRYEDKNKTVKGVIGKDYECIIELFYNYSKPVISSHYILQIQNPQITFDFFTSDGYEKNLEAIIVHRIRTGGMQIEGYPSPPHSNVLNTVPLGYLKMADLITWDKVNQERVINPWIWELKSGSISVNDLKEEIKRLSRRASYIEKLLKGRYKVTGIIVAERFPDKLFDLILPIGVIEHIVFISYLIRRGNVSFKIVCEWQ